VENAFNIARGEALRRSVTEIIIMGGVDIYTRTLPMVNRLEITEVHAEVEGDTRFPAIDNAVWEEVARIRHPAGPEDSADFSYVTYRRRPQH
jgi:dihydrofolate reductase